LEVVSGFFRGVKTLGSAVVRKRLLFKWPMLCWRREDKGNLRGERRISRIIASSCRTESFAFKAIIANT
jgi:hypothetical protein